MQLAYFNHGRLALYVSFLRECNTVHFRHIKEHYEGVAELKEETMSDAEKEFHHFKQVF